MRSLTPQGSITSGINGRNHSFPGSTLLHLRVVHHMLQMLFESPVRPSTFSEHQIGSASPSKGAPAESHWVPQDQTVDLPYDPSLLFDIEALSYCSIRRSTSRWQSRKCCCCRAHWDHLPGSQRIGKRILSTPASEEQLSLADFFYQGVVVHQLQLHFNAELAPFGHTRWILVDDKSVFDSE